MEERDVGSDIVFEQFVYDAIVVVDALFVDLRRSRRGKRAATRWKAGRLSRPGS